MIIYCDANPKMCAIVVGEMGNGGTSIEEFGTELTNNEAEYTAVIRALEDFPDATEIRTDSQLVVQQLNHKWHIKEDRLRSLAQRVWELVGSRNVKFTWVPRKENLAGKALK